VKDNPIANIMHPMIHWILMTTVLLALFPFTFYSSSITICVTPHNRDKLRAQEHFFVFCKLLLENFPSIYSSSLPYQDGATPAYVAAQYGHVEVLAVLRDAGADLNKATKVEGRAVQDHR